MGHKRLLITVLAAAALFGAAISGCNREREPRLASAAQRRGASLGSRPQAEFAEGVGVRPAEVLSASAHRGSPMRRMTRSRNGRAEQQQYSEARQRERQYREREYAARSAFSPAPAPVVRSGDLARYEPLPEPIPVHELYAARTQTYQTQSGPHYAAAGAPPVYNRTSVPVQPYAQQQYTQTAYTAPSAFISEPYTLEPSRTQPGMLEKVYAGGDGRGQPVQVHPSPELTMARAQLQGPAQARTVNVPPPTPESFPVPIPELEPIRYSRAPAGGEMRPVAMTPAPVRAVRQQPRIWQPQSQPRQQVQSLPQRPLPPLPSAYVWGNQSGGAAPQPAPVPAVTTAEPYRSVPALPEVTPAIQGWVASPTTAMRFFK